MSTELARTITTGTVALACALFLGVGPGCGGAAAAGDGTKTPQPTGESADAGPAAPSASAGPSTTTTDLPDAAASPSRLPQVTTPAAGDAGAATGHGELHTHEVGRTPADIRASVVAHRDEARACYDKALPDHPGIEGDLVIQWTIDPKGNVTQTSVDTTRSQITEPSVAACIANVIKGIQFAASPGGYETKAFYPFNFHPHHVTRPVPAH
jgi:hypothetical protein